MIHVEISVDSRNVHVDREYEMKSIFTAPSFSIHFFNGTFKRSQQLMSPSDVKLSTTMMLREEKVFTIFARFASFNEMNFCSLLSLIKEHVPSVTLS